MKKIILLILCFLLIGCDKDEYISRNLYYMDTVINIKIYNENDKKANDAIDYIDNLYKKYDLIASYYNSESELYKLNNNELNNVSSELETLINYGVDWYYKSNGLLNINIGGLTSRWKIFRENKDELPNIKELNKIDIDIENIDLTDIKNSKFNIDLGAIAKGYVTELAGKYLEDNGIEYYIINAGGNVKLGSSLKGGYIVGIKSPIDNTNFMKLKIENKSVVTSGGYERFYDYEGVRYHHIIDPVTKYPADYMKSVTVIGSDSGVCDALSTILFLMDIESGKEFIKDYNVDVIWFTNDDQVITSEGFNYEQK